MQKKWPKILKKAVIRYGEREPGEEKLNILVYEILKLEDIIHMIKTNIKSNHIRIENLYKSMFSEVESTLIRLNDNYVEIIHIDKNNEDSAILELREVQSSYIISYWDGYSLSETEESKDLSKALKIFKRYSKKMAKNLKRFA